MGYLWWAGVTSVSEYFMLEQQWQRSLLEHVVSGNGIVLRLCMEECLVCSLAFRI